MKIIVGGRRSGKTFRMILWFCETQDRAILVPNVQQRTHVIKEIIKAFPETGETTRAWVGRIWTPSRVMQERVGRNIKEVWIDNVDMLLRDMVGYGIPLTMSSTEEMDVEVV